MAQVRAEQGHGDDVEDDDRPALKALNDHLVGAGFPNLGQFGIGADGEVENMEDNEGEDSEAGPNHDFGGLAGSDGRFVGVGGASRLVLPHERDRCYDVEDEGAEENEACNPDHSTVSNVMEEVGVIIEGFFTNEDQHVT